MAFCGHINKAGQIVHDEVYNGLTRINLREGDDQHSARTYIIPNDGDSPKCQLSTVRYKEKKSHSHRRRESSGGESNSSPCRPSSSDSLYSWCEEFEVLPKCEMRENLVPSLHLNLSSANTSPNSCLRNVSLLKVGREPEAAYENWYMAKEKQRQLQQQQAKAERELQQQKAEERKRLAEQCYDRWRREKAHELCNRRVAMHMSAAAITASRQSLPDMGKYGRNVSPERVKHVVENWCLKKQLQLVEKREAKRKDELLKAEQQQRRLQMAQLAWQKWISKVADKPKPVPLCQGMDSLRATISELYVNPNSWVPPLDQKKD